MKQVKPEEIEAKILENRIDISTSVKLIVDEVREYGDQAVLKYSKRFDNYNGTIEQFELTPKDIHMAINTLNDDQIKAIKSSIQNVWEFAEFQKQSYADKEILIGENILGQRVIPIDIVGCYVPGGNFPLLSSAIMSIIPAKVAEVDEIIVCSPNIHPAVAATAFLAGATRIFNMGGPQAIAAMSYGTSIVPKVDKIVGPGSNYVVQAKKLVFGEVGIDMIAGPSEVMVITDKSADPNLVATDLIAQAEHDISSRIFVMGTDKAVLDKIRDLVKIKLISLSTLNIAEKSIQNGFSILVKSLDEAVSLANKIAPEHLGLHVKAPSKLCYQLKHYGSLFIGGLSSEVFGDYSSGTNHILPTSGTARFTGGLSVGSFLKIQTYQKITERGLKNVVETASILADLEGLEGHKLASIARINVIDQIIKS